MKKKQNNNTTNKNNNNEKPNINTINKTIIGSIMIEADNRAT